MGKKEEEEQKRINKLVEEELESREKLEDLQKRMNQDIATYLQQNINISESKKKIREIQEEIGELNAESLDLEGDALKTAEGKIKVLKSEAAQMVKINNEAKNLNSLTKSIGNHLSKKAVEGLESLNNKLQQQIPGFYEIFDTLMSADLAVRETTRDLGLTGVQAEAMKNSMYGAASYAAALGVDVEQMARAQGNFAEATGRAVVFSRELNQDLVDVAKGTGMSMEAAGTFAANLALAGQVMNDSKGVMQEVVDSSAKLGLHSGDVAKTLSENLNLMNRMKFKNGIGGLTKLVQISKKYRIELSEIEALSNKIFRPEGAIELAANLQMLGGAFSRMGDPFTLMYRARNAPEELAQSIANATAESASFVKETGKFNISALELDRLRQVAEATGMSYESLHKSAIVAAKATQIQGQFGFKFNKDTMDFLTTVSEFDLDKKGFVITMPNNEKKLLKDLTSTEILAMQARDKDLQKRAELALTFDKAFGNFMNSLKLAFLPILNGLNYFTEFIASISTYFGEGSAWGKAVIATLTLGGLVLVTTMGALIPKLIGGLAGGLVKLVSKIPGLGGAAGGGGGFMSSFFGGLKTVSAAKLLAFGAAMLALGQGVALAARGMGELVKSFSELTGEQIVGATLSVFGLSFAFWKMTAAVAGLGAASASAVIPILGVGLAILAMGTGVWLAATGMSSLVDSFKGMSSGEMLAAGGAVILMAAGISILTAALVAAAGLSGVTLAGIGVMSLAFAALGAATSSVNMAVVNSVKELTSIPDDKLNKIKDLFDSAAKAKPLTITLGGSAKVEGDISIEGIRSDLLSDEFVRKISNKVLEVVQSQKQVLVKGGSSGSIHLA